MQPPMKPNDPRQPGGQSFYEEDTGYAPELRAERSENLYRREDGFWQTPVEGQGYPQKRPRNDDYFNHPEQFHQTYRRKPKPRRGSYAVALVVCVALVLAATVILLASPLFAVKEIRVTGNATVSTEEIVGLSGLQVGMNRFAVNQEEVTRRLERNHYLICELVHMPAWGVVEIRVREREVAAVIDYNGLMYYADNRGMVLEEFSTRDESVTANKILVSGLGIRRCDVGRVVTLVDETQLSVYNEILVELKVMGALSRISELDMSSMESIFLMTRDGYTVRLGNGSDIHRKLRAMILTLDALVRDGYPLGTMDVTAPVNPTFMPYESELPQTQNLESRRIQTKIAKNCFPCAFPIGKRLHSWRKAIIMESGILQLSDFTPGAFG